MEELMKPGEQNGGDYPKSIEEMLKTLEEARQNTIALAPTARIAERITEEWRAANAGPYVVVHADGFMKRVHISVYKAEAFGEVTSWLRSLAKAGFHQVREPEDKPSIQSRTWHLRGGHPGEIDLTVNLSHAKCKYVEVGKRQVPIFELRCEETEKAAETQA